MLGFRIIVICLSFIIVVSSIPYQTHASEIKTIKAELTASCGRMPFGGEQIGSFELETHSIENEIGGKTSQWIESLKIWMKEPPSKGDYLVGFMNIGGWDHNLNDALVDVDEYRSDGRIIIVSKELKSFFYNVLFVAQRDKETTDRYWPGIDVIGTAYLVSPLKSFPEPNKFEYKNSTIIHTLGVAKDHYNVGEMIELSPEIINTGSENLTIIHRRPLFWINAYSLDGKPMYLRTSGEDVGVQADLMPRVPYDYTWSTYPNRTAYDYDIRFCTPGEYKIVSYAEVNAVERIEQGYSTVKEVKIYAEPVTIKVNPVPYFVDEPVTIKVNPVIITKVELWGPAYFVEGVDICGWGKSSISDAFQWVEIRNTKEESVKILDDWSITVTNGTQLSFVDGFTLGPKESCLIQTADVISVRIGHGGSGGLGPPGGYNLSAVILKYSVETDRVMAAYKDSTPELSDTYGDTRNWQLIDGEWVFKNGKLPDADRTTLTEITEDGSVIVNLILAEEITAPTESKFRVSFIDALTQQLMDNVSYQMIFEGTSMPVNTSSVPLALVSKDNPFKREWSIDGFAENGTDTQIYSITSPGSLNITIRILGINNEPLAKALDVKFATLAASGFREPLRITEVELDSDDGGQWIEIYNPMDRPISASKLVLKQLGGKWAVAFFGTPLETGFGKENFTMNSVTLQPHEYRVFEISSEDDPSEERFLTSRSVLSLVINEREVSRTPELTDNDVDSRTWQLEGKQWVFAEATPMRAIPEFPIALIILTLSFAGIFAVGRIIKM